MSNPRLNIIDICVIDTYLTPLPYLFNLARRLFRRLFATTNDQILEHSLAGDVPVAGG